MMDNSTVKKGKNNGPQHLKEKKIFHNTEKTVVHNTEKTVVHNT